MEFSITTPAILFPAISLLLLAYTNRFLAIASLIRNLKTQYLQNHNPKIIEQISNLRKRIYLIKNMQACGIASFFLCVISMILLFNAYELLAKYAFGFSLVLMLMSLYLSLREIQISVEALRIELSELENIGFEESNSGVKVENAEEVKEVEKAEILRNGLS